ncbi:outer membrane protein, partial [Mesorhizobium marinum]|uniref:outer membrane protein n=1 Tax=Mesorhizobium marinum TaxID=3228790 RepID=UPI003466E3D4
SAPATGNFGVYNSGLHTHAGLVHFEELLMRTFIVTALFLGSASFADTADAVVEEVVVVDTTYNWSGVYVGGQIGYAFDGSADYVHEGISGFYSHDPDGLIGGIYAGYNYQFANGIVLGGEADIALGDVEDSSVLGLSPFSARTEVDWMGAVRGRLGYAYDRFLPYVAGGVAFGHYRFEEFSSGNPYGDHDGSMVGWTIGAGAEYAVTDNWIVRGEYRYTDFDEKHFTANHSGDEYDVDIDIHDFRFGVAYKF